MLSHSEIRTLPLKTWRLNASNDQPVDRWTTWVWVYHTCVVGFAVVKTRSRFTACRSLSYGHAVTGPAPPGLPCWLTGVDSFHSAPVNRLKVNRPAGSRLVIIIKNGGK
ncbi:hypothetical protein EYF80_047012 [Liparis tanakae]|uniref:Uncharacterized protein n=1 Tax=Liparis tanakae TaxID=230148 RepID=A0A4Z2FR13_9TELE|nr:hypothetical protein EYF80_047012 [Liparis tanakae]